MASSTYQLSRRAQAIHESATLAIAAEAKRMSAAGIDVVSLSTGEPDFPSPEVVKEAAIEAIRADFTHYTQSEGIAALRTAIADKFREENGIETDPTRILVSNGGKHSIHTALLSMVDEGDEVLIPAPYWTSYPDLVLLAGGVPVVVESSPALRYKVDPSLLEAKTTPQTRALILNSPSNPTGVMYTQSELEEIARWAAHRGIVIVSDELYEKIVYDGRRAFSVGSMPEMTDLAVTVNGVSKAYSMTGWRIGYMTGPKELMDAAARIQSQATSNACSISQMAALAALTKTTTEVEQMVAAFAKRRDVAVELAQSIPDVTFPVPDGAFYLLLDVEAYLGGQVDSDIELARRLLVESGVAVVPGSAFGAAGTVRISYACSEQNIVAGISRIRSGLASMRS